jgi:hypothetical protein
MARLERATGEQCELAIAIVEQRRSTAEQRAVEVGVDAAQGHWRKA